MLFNETASLGVRYLASVSLVVDLQLHEFEETHAKMTRVL